MSLTLVELCEKLKEVEETILLEKLDITSEDLVNRFEDVIENRFEELEQDYREEGFNENKWKDENL